MPDWNNDGNYDWQDSAMDYWVYKNVVGKGGGGSGSGGSCLSMIVLGIIILYLLSALGSCMG